MKARSALLPAVLVLVPALAHAGASDWHEMTGGKLRLVTEQAADADGMLRGALEIRLDEGWKTYWQEPGESGVAPQISLHEPAAADSVSLRFPAPQRFDDGTSQWAGYAGNVTLPVVVTGFGTDGGALGVDVFLGVCETICVPVQATLSVTPGEDVGPIDQAAITTAFANLPAEAQDGFEVVATTRHADVLAVEVDLPEGIDRADIFLAGHDGLMLAAPEFAPAPKGGTFTARIVAPAKGGAIAADYTLVAGDEAVAGTIALP
jgi:DsbC/DsbD-like thiol-disulfide interchange protein